MSAIAAKISTVSIANAKSNNDMKKPVLIVIIVTLFQAMLLPAMAYIVYNKVYVPVEYREYYYPTQKLGEGVNDVQGIILHHTATRHTQSTVWFLCDSIDVEASCHVLIAKSGTRYVLAPPTAVTWHAGYSMLNGRERCNDFTVGIEFMGNTVEAPLTKRQINSAIEYIVPIMKEYGIPKENIVTHEYVRRSWMQHHPDLVAEKGVETKVDITPKEYARLMSRLEKRLEREGV